MMKKSSRALLRILVFTALALCSPFAALPPPAAASTNSAEAATLNASIGRDAYVHDPSTIVKCKDEFWVFSTGRGVMSYHSKDLLKWERGPRVFDEPPGWVAQAVPANRRLDYWAPDIARLGDRYLLYYSASSFGKNTSALGLATNPTLDTNDPAYHWTDQGMVIQSGKGDDFNTIDPAVFHDADGSLWLSFGSFWSGIRMIQLDPRTGRRIAPDSPVLFLAHHDSIEASYIYQRGRWYYLFVNWGMCCRGEYSTYNIRVGRGNKLTGPYLDKNGVNMLDGGGSLFLDSIGGMIGPGHAGIIVDQGKSWFSCHFESDAARRGASSLAILPLHLTDNGWPEVDWKAAAR